MLGFGGVKDLQEWPRTTGTNATARGLKVSVGTVIFFGKTIRKRTLSLC